VKIMEVEAQTASTDRADQMSECAACGYSGPDPVREVLHGGDGPNATIATTLFEHLDQEPKKILAFADSRQEAAYFAWYLDDTYRSLLRRSFLYRALKKEWGRNRESQSLSDIAEAYRRECVQAGLTDEAAAPGEQRRTAWESTYWEFLTQESRISLAGVGLVTWSMQWPNTLKPPQILCEEPWSLSLEDARALTFLLLDRFRIDRAVELNTREYVELDWHRIGVFGSQRIVRLGLPRGQSHVSSWNGPRGWRIQFLIKILEKRGYDHERALAVVEKTLLAVWDQIVRFSDQQPSETQLLTRVKDGRRLNPVWWRATPVTDDDPIYRCDTCSRIETLPFQDICSRLGCRGRLQLVQPAILSDNHYRSLYQGELRGNLIVEEHTAQLATERAREVQRDFQEGRINVLSCSTTFELGVDLGDLNMVFLRNVPPEPFNYVQRVGRAGRRAGSPGFAVTYCRRGPHDLFHFSDPTRLLAGRTKPPTLSLDNTRVAERHLSAAVLSEFFRQFPDRFVSVCDLIEDWSAPTTVTAVRDFLHANQTSLGIALEAIFPRDLAGRLGITNGSWIERIAGSDSRLHRAELEVTADYQRADELETSSRNAGQYPLAGWAQRRKKTIAVEDVLSFLSRKTIIPKYGFPVDVVELDTQGVGIRQGYDVSLTRDLTIAIGEFAPTATLVACKHEWESCGLKKVPEKEWERKNYKVCHRHNLMVTWNDGEIVPNLPCGDLAPERRYVIPTFGFTTSNKPPKPPSRRPTRLFTTRPYFLRPAGEPRGEIVIAGNNGPLATIREAIPGCMAVLSEGRKARQFHICNTCGAGFLDRKAGATHKTPWNVECLGTLSCLSLGHEFVTDVVQVEFHLAPNASQEPTGDSGLALGIAFALLQGLAETVDVPPTDLNVTVGRAGSAGLPTSERSPTHWIVLTPTTLMQIALLQSYNVLPWKRRLRRPLSHGSCLCRKMTSPFFLRVTIR
jgi:Helicase conserved C-terminal domain